MTPRKQNNKSTSRRTSSSNKRNDKPTEKKSYDRKSSAGKPSERTSSYGKSSERSSSYGKSSDRVSSYGKSSADKTASRKPFKKKLLKEVVNNNLKRDEDGTVRLNKFIADSGLCSRRKADEHIADGDVSINGKIVKELGTRVTLSDRVTVNGDPVSYYTKNIYILLNKPKDSITTTSDELGRKTVMDIVKRRERIFPVGRLDRNTTGVLIMTNDGELANRLTHPSYEIEKVYKATLDKKLNFEHAKKIAEGVELEDGKTAPCFLFIEPTDNTKITIVLKEGKYREIRRMFEHFGYIVKKLDRKEFAGLTNSGIKRGDYRFLTTKEINDLKKKVKMLQPNK